MRVPALPRICVALSGPTMLQTAETLLPTGAFFEFRLDTLHSPAAFLPALESFLDQHPHVHTIATCRRTANGGHFSGTARDEARILHASSIAGATIVDLSLESAEELQAAAPEELNILRHSPAALLLSWHDFHATPDLEAIHARLARHRPDLLKIVPTASTLADALRLLTLLQQHRANGNLIAMSMGTPGILTRVLGPSRGSLFTFAAPSATNATAPGQLDLQTLQDLYKVESITTATQVYGVFGNPVTSSKSPAMLNAAFAATGIDAVYLPLQAETAADLFQTAEALPLAGASVTMPLKELILPRLTQDLDPLAATIGAANTLVRTGPNLRGYNTDAAGITVPLARRIPLQGANILVLGAGGAARAAVFALRAAGARVSILNRSPQRAQVLADQSGSAVLTRTQAADTRFDAILNATPHGMHGQTIEAPLTANEMNTQVFFDLVYNPLETPLLRQARARGITVIPGLEMFLAQGAAQFTLWTGQPAPLDVMRSAVLAALANTPG